MRGIYCGPLTNLQGEKALLIEVPGSDNVKAQFDNMELTGADGKDLWHGWTIFRRSHFLIEPPVDWSDDKELPGYVQSALGMNKR